MYFSIVYGKLQHMTMLEKAAFHIIAVSQQADSTGINLHLDHFEQRIPHY